MNLDAILHEHPSFRQRFFQSPYLVLAQTLNAQRQRVTRKPKKDTLNISVVCVSDTHNTTPELPPGDLLVHAGDLTQGGTMEEIQRQIDWLDVQPHTYKVVIAGNHDIILDDRASKQHGMDPFRRREIVWGSVIYLERTGATLTFPNGISLSLYGSPDTRKNWNWAFQFDRGVDAFTGRVQEGTEILITHSPPRFYLDGAGWGDEFLLRELWRVRPRLHVFGHIHESAGVETLTHDRFGRLYEQVCAKDARLLALAEMVLRLGMLWVASILGFDNKADQTVLVNAAAVSGLADTTRGLIRVVHL